MVVGALAAAARLGGRPAARWLSCSRCFCAATKSQADIRALGERKSVEHLFPKASRQGVKAEVKGLNQMFEKAQLGGAKSAVSQTTPAQLNEIERMFDHAAAQRTGLHTELVEQKEMSSKHAEMLSKTLEAAAAERVQLREQVDKLSSDLHLLTSQLTKEQVGVRQRIQRTDVRGKGGQSRLAYRPTKEDAERQPTHVCELSHQTLAELSMLGNHSAHRERLLREIMAVDGVSWERAHEVLDKFDEYNERYYALESFPYRFCIWFTSIVCVLFSLMVFWKPLAHWYGVNVAGEELSEGVSDISELTTNQVGTWTWSWMEPMIGVASFVLLCCQFSRAQLKKMNMKTYCEQMLSWRADRLAKRFPEYDQSMVRAWAKHMPSVDMTLAPVYERNAGLKGPASGL